MSKKRITTPVLSLAIVVFSAVFFGLYMVDQSVHRGTKIEYCGNMPYTVLELGFPLVSTKVIPEGDAGGQLSACVPLPEIAGGATASVIVDQAKVRTNILAIFVTATIATLGIVYARNRRV